METETVIFNIFISRKIRGKPMEQKYFSLEILAEANEHEVIRSFVQSKYPGWQVGGYAPLKREQPVEN